MSPALSRAARRAAGLERRPPAPVRIVHLGLGAFARAHQAWYTDAVDDRGEWGIAAFTGRSPDAARRLAAQDGLFTLIERDADGDRASVIESLVEARDGADLPRMLALLSSPDTAVVTLTVTESGYRLAADGSRDPDDAALAADRAVLAGGEPGDPVTVLGRLIAGLRARRDADAGGLAVVPCDNLPGNGAMLRRGVLELAEEVDPALAGWIAREVSFVSTSVDRITPAASAADAEVAASLTGWADADPVVAEPFRDWVLCGSFPAGRPAWERAGARFVDDIEPFERRKLWLLNAAHSALAYAGAPLGYGTVAEAIADPACRVLVDGVWDEAARQLPAELGVDDYRAALLQRFGNARIEHRLAQIGAEGATKLGVRIVPVLRAERAAGRRAEAGVATIAAWVSVLLRGEALIDAHRDAIDAALTRSGDERVAALLEVVSPGLSRDAALVDEVAAAIR